MIPFNKKSVPLSAFCLLFFLGCNFPQNKQESNFVTTTYESTGNAKLDSLLQEAAKGSPDTNLVKTYFQIGEIFKNNDSEKAKEYYLKVKNLSEQLGWLKGDYLFATRFSLLLNRENLPDSSIKILQNAYHLIKELNDDVFSGHLCFSLGNAYLTKDWNTTALSYYLEALTRFERINDTLRLPSVYDQVSQLYTKINVLEKAIEYGEKSVCLAPDKPYALFGLASAYLKAQQYEKSNRYFEETLQLSLQQENTYMLGITYLKLSINALAVFDIKNAEIYSKLAKENAEKIGNQQGKSASLILMSKVEMIKGNYSNAEKYAKEALQIANEIDYIATKRDCYQALTEIAIAQHKHREQIQYVKETDALEIAIAEHRDRSATAEVEAKYEIAKKNLEIAQQQNIINKQNIQLGILLSSILVFAVILALLWVMLRLRKRRNQALADMNATKDKFFSIISHDLKSPALSQREAVRQLAKNAHSWDIATLTEHYDMLLRLADKQVELLYNLLGWAKVQTGKMSFTPLAFNLLVHLRKDISLIREMANSKDISLSEQTPDDVIIIGDRNMLATVVRNLLTNAVKFTPAGGKVILSIEPASDSKYSISISDTGIGMSKEQIESLYRLENIQTSLGTAEEEGSGLGLIVCRELLEIHGTLLNIESEQGKGSKFWFTVAAPQASPINSF